MGALCNSPSQDSESGAAVEAVGNDSHIDNKESNTDSNNKNNNNNQNNPTTTTDNPKNNNNPKPRSNSRARAVPPIPRVLIIQNDVICPPATAIASLVDHQIPYQVIYAFHEKAFLLLKPEMYEAIIVLGGRADVYSEAQYPWLIPEKAFLKEALYLDIPILGICLGCQLLAECSGGTVIAGKYGSEVGYKDWIFHSEMNETIMNNINSNLTNAIVNNNNNNNNNNDENKDNNNNNNTLGLTHLGSSEGSVNRKPSESNISTVVRAADDPFLYALKDKDLDKYVILFHGDTFTLANKLKTQSGDKKITLLASTDLYPTLFRVGKNSYGFQGHPELTPDLILVWTRGWGDEWLSKLTIDIENDVRKYAQNNHDNIIFSSLTLFDIWIDITLEDDCVDDNPKQFEEYTAQHWNRANDKTLQAYERSVLGTQANDTPNNDNDNNDNNDNDDASESGIPYPAGAHTRTNTNTRHSGVGTAALNLNLKLANNESERITGPTFKPPNVDNPMMHVPGASPLKAISQDDEIE